MICSFLTLMKYRNAASTSIGTSISSGQTIFFNSEGTWLPYSPIPLLMVWNPRIMEDPRGNDYAVRNEKNKKALDTMYSTNMTAVGVNNKHLQLRKNAVTKLTEEIGKEEITKLMKFSQDQSNYSGIEDGKIWAERLGIIFSGAYNNGIPCFKDERCPCTVVEKNFQFVALRKENWQCFLEEEEENDVDEALDDFFLAIRNVGKWLSGILDVLSCIMTTEGKHSRQFSFRNATN